MTDQELHLAMLEAEAEERQHARFLASLGMFDREMVEDGMRRYSEWIDLVRQASAETSSARVSELARVIAGDAVRALEGCHAYRTLFTSWLEQEPVTLVLEGGDRGLREKVGVAGADRHGGHWRHRVGPMRKEGPD